MGEYDYIILGAVVLIVILFAWSRKKKKEKEKKQDLNFLLSKVRDCCNIDLPEHYFELQYSDTII